MLSLSFPESWSSWSEWSHCDSNGAQLRVRHCDVLFPTGNQCSGNNSETRPCSPDSNFIPGDHTCTFTHTWMAAYVNTHTFLIFRAPMHDMTTHKSEHTHTLHQPTTHHHMPPVVIQLISKIPVIMKYTIDPSERLVSGQRSGSAAGQHFWGWLVLVSCSRTPECGRWLHGGVNPVAALKGSLSTHSNNPAAVLASLWVSESCQVMQKTLSPAVLLLLNAGGRNVLCAVLCTCSFKHFSHFFHCLFLWHLCFNFDLPFNNEALFLIGLIALRQCVAALLWAVNNANPANSEMSPCFLFSTSNLQFSKWLLLAEPQLIELAWALSFFADFLKLKDFLETCKCDQKYVTFMLIDCA